MNYLEQTNLESVIERTDSLINILKKKHELLLKLNALHNTNLTIGQSEQVLDEDDKQALLTLCDDKLQKIDKNVLTLISDNSTNDKVSEVEIKVEKPAKKVVQATKTEPVKAESQEVNDIDETIEDEEMPF